MKVKPPMSAWSDVRMQCDMARAGAGLQSRLLQRRKRAVGLDAVGDEAIYAEVGDDGDIAR